MLAHKLRRASRRDIVPIDDGDAALSSGAGTTTHTYSAQTSTGPSTVLGITYGNTDSSSPTLTGATWNGVAMDIRVQTVTTGDGDEDVGPAVATIAGAQSGDIVLTFSGNCEDSEITKISLTGVVSLVPVDTDSETAIVSATQVDLDALTSPGVGGIRIGVYAQETGGTGVSWNAGTELSDIDTGVYRHSVAYIIGDDATAFGPTDGSGNKAIVGVSIR